MTEPKMKKLIFYFKLYDLLYVLLAFNAFVNGSAVMEIATLILVLFGAVTAVCMAAQFHVYRKMPNIWIIAAFLVSYLISSGLTRQYGVTDNLKEMLWLGISMIVIYGSSYMYEPDEMKQEFRILAWVWVAYCTIANLVSLSMVVWGRGYKIGSGATAKVVGLKWGRLWGIYDDPNHGGTIAVAAILLTIYLIVTAKKKMAERDLSVYDRDPVCLSCIVGFPDRDRIADGRYLFLGAFPSVSETTRERLGISDPKDRISIAHCDFDGGSGIGCGRSRRSCL